MVIDPNSYQLKSAEGEQAMSEDFSWAKISSATSEICGMSKGKASFQCVELEFYLMSELFPE